MVVEIKAKRSKSTGVGKPTSEGNPAYRKKRTHILALCKEVGSGFPLKFHDLGTHVNELKDIPKYGKNAVQQLMTDLNRAKETLENAKRLADSYEADEVKRLCALDSEDGWSMSCRHLLHAAGIDNRPRRLKLLTQAAKEEWTAAELEQQIQKTKPPEQKSNAGRPLKKPDELPGMLRQQENETDRLLQRNDEVWSNQNISLVRLAEKVTDEATASEQLKVIDRLERNFDRLVAAAKLRLADCRAARELLKAKAPETEEVAETGSEQAQDHADVRKDTLNANTDDRDIDSDAALPER
jgi:hypothetical protein